MQWRSVHFGCPVNYLDTALPFLHDAKELTPTQHPTFRRSKSIPCCKLSKHSVTLVLSLGTVMLGSFSSILFSCVAPSTPMNAATWSLHGVVTLTKWSKYRICDNQHGAIKIRGSYIGPGYKLPTINGAVTRRGYPEMITAMKVVDYRSCYSTRSSTLRVSQSCWQLLGLTSARDAFSAPGWFYRHLFKSSWSSTEENVHSDVEPWPLEWFEREWIEWVLLTNVGPILVVIVHGMPWWSCSWITYRVSRKTSRAHRSSVSSEIVQEYTPVHWIPDEPWSWIYNS